MNNNKKESFAKRLMNAVADAVSAAAMTSGSPYGLYVDHRVYTNRPLETGEKPTR